jgi:nucleoid DNA-binding protein
MEGNIFKKDDLVEMLHEKTGFYKKNMLEVANALEEIILECFQAATFEQPSELHLAPGVVLIGTRKHKGEAKDPRTGEIIISPEKVIPSATFKQSIRQKLYKKPKGYKKKNKKG